MLSDYAFAMSNRKSALPNIKAAVRPNTTVVVTLTIPSCDDVTTQKG
jgi:hypothetical protein